MNKILPKEYNFLIPCPQQTLSRMGVNKDGGYIVNEKLINNSNILIRCFDSAIGGFFFNGE